MKSDGIIVERFLTLLNNPGHKGEGLSDAVAVTLKLHEVNMLDKRGQFYDNTANMKDILLRASNQNKK